MEQRRSDELFICCGSVRMLEWLLLLLLGGAPFLLAYLICAYSLCRRFDDEQACRIGCHGPRSGFYAVRLVPDDPNVAGGAL